MLKKEEVERAFLGIMRLVKEGSEGRRIGGVHDNREAKVGLGTTFSNPCNP